MHRTWLTLTENWASSAVVASLTGESRVRSYHHIIVLQQTLREIILHKSLHAFLLHKTLHAFILHKTLHVFIWMIQA